MNHCFFFFKQKTAYEMRISDWGSDVCSSDLGLIQAGSMQDIMQYLRAHPAEGAAIMNENKSFVFFRELTGAGPLGAMGVAVTPEATVAADPRYVPLGAPVLLSLDRAEPNGIWIAQDTGGANKGDRKRTRLNS